MLKKRKRLDKRIAFKIKASQAAMDKKKNQNLINSLEVKGCFVLAEEVRKSLDNVKESRRSSKINAIKYAAEIRDKLEATAIRLLSDKIGDKSKDLVSLLNIDFDKLEDKFNRVLLEHLEFKSNNTKEDVEKKNEEEKEEDSTIEEEDSNDTSLNEESSIN